MKKVVLSVVVVVAVVVAVLSSRALFGPSRADGLGASELARVVRGDVATIVKATGVVRPAIGAEVRVGAQVSGVLRRVRVRVGDTVKKGQPLAEIDPRELAARRDQAAAKLQSSLANQRFARVDLARQSRLAAAQAVAPSELDLAERAAALADAAVAEARADLAFAGVLLDQTRIVAPIDGVISSVTVQEGEAVAAGLAAPSVVTVIDPSRLEVWAYVDETDIGRIRLGQKVHFGVDTYPEHELRGEITAIYPKPEIRDNVVDYIAVVRFVPEADRTLRPEMTASVRIALEAREGVLVVPRRAVRRDQGRTFVFCPQGRGFARRPVTVGARDESSQEIVEGLREGEQVLLGDAPAIATVP